MEIPGPSLSWPPLYFMLFQFMRFVFRNPKTLFFVRTKARVDFENWHTYYPDDRLGLRHYTMQIFSDSLINVNK